MDFMMTSINCDQSSSCCAPYVPYPPECNAAPQCGPNATAIASEEHNVLNQKGAIDTFCQAISPHNALSASTNIGLVVGIAPKQISKSAISKSQDTVSTVVLDKVLTDYPGWKKLPADKKQKLQTNEGFVKLGPYDQQMIVDKVANKKMDNKALAEFMPLLNSISKINGQEERGQVLCYCLDILHKNVNYKKLPEIEKALCQLLDSSFKTDSDRVNIFRQAAYNPNIDVIENLTNLSNILWFKVMSVADRDRAATSIARLTFKASTSANSKERQKVLNNALKPLLDGEITLSFKGSDDAHLYGHANNGNIVIINEKIDNESEYTILNTIPHEVNHVLNKDGLNRATFESFLEEYRAWYTGYIAEHGKQPNRQEAFERCYELLEGKLYPEISAILDEPPRYFSEEDKQARNNERGQITYFMKKEFSIGRNERYYQLTIDDLNGAKLNNPKGTAPDPDVLFKMYFPSREANAMFK